MRNYYNYIYFPVLTLLLLLISQNAAGNQSNNIRNARGIYIDSYNLDFEWSEEITESIKRALAEELKSLSEVNIIEIESEYVAGEIRNDFLEKIHKRIDPHKFNLLIIHWDSKNRPDPKRLKSCSENSQKIIDFIKPSFVIGSDDNVSEYLISPNKNTDVNYIFCGVNWDATKYGFPASNITGMIEVSPVERLVRHLRKYAKGKQIGYLALTNLSNMIDGKYFKRIFEDQLLERYITFFEEWKRQYLWMQKNVDMLIVAHNGGLQDWDNEEAYRFVLNNTQIPTGATLKNMTPFVLINFAKIASEQGEWASKIAAKLLVSGKKAGTIPIVANTQGIMMLNIPLSKKMKIKFDIRDIRNTQESGDFFEKGELSSWIAPPGKGEKDFF